MSIESNPAAPEAQTSQAFHLTDRFGEFAEQGHSLQLQRLEPGEPLEKGIEVACTCTRQRQRLDMRETGTQGRQLYGRVDGQRRTALPPPAALDIAGDLTLSPARDSPCDSRTALCRNTGLNPAIQLLLECRVFGFTSSQPASNVFAQ
ncbi:hypothetical protein D3C84_886440 [compost metagenome]